MNPKEFKKALDFICKEKGIEESVVVEAMQAALTTAYRKNFGKKEDNIRVDVDTETGNIRVFVLYNVVDNSKKDIVIEPITEETDEEIDPDEVREEAFNEETEVTLDESKKYGEYSIGDVIQVEVTPEDFGRVAAGAAKQVVMQKIREAERNNIIEEFSDKENELMIGFLAMEDARNYYVDLGKARGILPKTELIPGETLKMGSSVKVYITKIESTPKGPLILTSRKHYGFIKRLFEHEIPEFAEGILVMHAVAREAGLRSKVAVQSLDSKVDAIGACIGEKGTRIASIIKELNGEKIDLILYSDNQEEFIANALSPAKNLNVTIVDERKKESLVITDEENLSLAIGKKGINIILATRLTRYKIMVKTLKEINEEINEK